MLRIRRGGCSTVIGALQSSEVLRFGEPCRDTYPAERITPPSSHSRSALLSIAALPGVLVATLLHSADHPPSSRIGARSLRAGSCRHPPPTVGRFHRHRCSSGEDGNAVCSEPTESHVVRRKDRSSRCDFQLRALAFDSPLSSSVLHGLALIGRCRCHGSTGMLRPAILCPTCFWSVPTAFIISRQSYAWIRVLMSRAPHVGSADIIFPDLRNGA